MRIDRFTNQLQTALADAQSLAVGRDHSQLESVHLMQALLDQLGGAVRPLLAQAGFDVTGLRNALAKSIYVLARVHKHTGDVCMSQELGRKMLLSVSLAQ